jgi:hypothetical protein
MIGQEICSSAPPAFALEKRLPLHTYWLMRIPDRIEQFERECREMTLEELAFVFRAYWRSLQGGCPIQSHPDWPKWTIICDVLRQKMEAEPEVAETARGIMFPR